MKSIMAQDTLVSLPQYGQEFTVHTDASDKQIGGIISQDTGEKFTSSLTSPRSLTKLKKVIR